MNRFRNKHNHLSFERLEERRVLAGNVHVLINDAILLVVGDGLDNQVQIAQDTAGRFVVTGIDSTTINGGANPLTVGTATHVTVSMGNGNDDVSVSAMNVRSNFSFFGGFGNDRLQTRGLNARHFHGEGNPGDDVFDLNFNIRKSAYLYLGAGNDVVSSATMNAGRNLKIYGHAGNDTFSSDNLNVGRKLEFHLGTGNDDVLLSGNTSVGSYARFSLGTGNDFVGVLPAQNGGRAEFRGFVAVDAREGSNNIAFDSSVNVSGRLRTESGDGPNTLRTGGADFGSQQTVGFGNLSEGAMTAFVDRVFATLDAAGIGEEIDIPFVALSASTSTNTLVVAENSPGVSADGAFNLTGSENINGGEVRIANFVAGQEQLSFTNQSGITGTFDNTTGILTLAGSASTSSYQAAIRSVAYENTSDSPLTDARQIEFVLTNEDETITVTREFRVTAVNDAPTITPDNANQTVLPTNLPVFVDDLMSIADVDTDNLDSAIVRFSSGFVSGEDVLSVVDANGITSSFNAVSGIMTLTGNASVAQWQTVLQTVAYDNSASDPTIGTRTITVSVNDGETNSAAQSFQINIQQPTQPNNFVILSSAANGTVVGRVTTSGSFTSPLFQVSDNSIPADLVLNADDHLSGDVTASVVLIEYLDFQCPACAGRHPLVQQLKSDFPDDVLVVSRHFPIESIHLNARESALFAEAANRQGMFDEMTDLLFTNQNDWAGVADPTSIFEGYANTLGLDLTQVQSDVADAALDTRITRDLNEGLGLGVSSTPTFYSQGSQITLPSTQSDFTQVVQDALADLDSAFTINRTTGEIIVRDNTLLNPADTPVTIPILVVDAAGNAETVNVTINIAIGN